ncbi:hypothetical protein ACFLZX_03045 [Nanoarchaeota archaeon]
MGRKPARELIKRILQSITDSPKSIHEIANDAESNWESVKEYLESLKEAGIVQENSIANKRVFSLVTCSVPKKNGNYFDLPIIEKDDRMIASLFSKIKEDWKQVTGKVPGKIQVQKSLLRINKLCKLDLPIGWYLFGAMCVKPYDPMLDYGYQPLGGEIETCVQEVVNEYSKEPTAYSLKIRQYQEEDKVLYQTKELILSLFTSSKFSKKYISEINKLLYTLINNLPVINDNDSRSLVNEFTGAVLQLINNIPEEEIQHAKQDVLQAFNEVWKLIALYGYSTDLKSYYEANYDASIILKHFNLEMNLQKLEVIEHLSNLDSLTPANVEPEDEAYQNLKKVLGKGKFLSADEQKQKDKELESMNKSELLGKFGLN